MKLSDTIQTIKRHSLKRDAVLELLRSGRLDHPTADEVYCKMRKIYPAISLGTVYRNLNDLSVSGEIVKISAPAQPDRFDITTAPHLHFKCSRCGKVLDIMTRRPLSGLESSLDKKGFLTENISVSITGLCPKCAKEKL